MDLTGDELAGVVDLFGGLYRGELTRALAELAYRQGEEYDPSHFEGDIDDAIRSYHLVAVDERALEGSVPEGGGESADETEGIMILAGPLAFPTLPPDARDLPHILDIETRQIATDEVGAEVVERFRADARDAIDAGDEERIETLLDASYELEAWADVDVQGIREELAAETHTS